MRLLYKVEVDNLKDAISSYEKLLIKLSLGVITTDTSEDCMDKVICAGEALIQAIEISQDVAYYGE